MGSTKVTDNTAMAEENLTPSERWYDGLKLFPWNKPADLDYIRYKLDFNEKDVICVSHPKTGSTWMSELIYQIITDVDHQTAMETTIGDKALFLEYADPTSPYKSVREQVEATSSPRLVRSHLPLRYFQRNLDKLEKGPKFIIPIRNPKDTLVSYYHFCLILPQSRSFKGTWNAFFEMHQDRLRYGNIFEHTAAWWQLKDHPNILIIKYEDHIKDPLAVLQRTARFLGKTLTMDRMQTILSLTSFQHMSSDAYKYDRNHFRETDTKRFFRSGKVGGWKDVFTAEQNQYIEEQCEKVYAPIGLTFEYEPHPLV